MIFLQAKCWKNTCKGNKSRRRVEVFRRRQGHSSRNSVFLTFEHAESLGQKQLSMIERPRICFRCMLHPIMRKEDGRRTRPRVKESVYTHTLPLVSEGSESESKQLPRRISFAASSFSRPPVCSGKKTAQVKLEAWPEVKGGKREEGKSGLGMSETGSGDRRQKKSFPFICSISFCELAKKKEGTKEEKWGETICKNDFAKRRC